MSAELLPCPFCGSADVLFDDSAFMYAAYCNSCGVETSAGGDKAEAIKTWNTRATQPQAPQGAVTGWQPIETAPQDGTPIMGCTWIPTIQQLYSPRRIYWAAYHPNSAGKMCWRDADICGNKLERLTHWRPLEAAPETPEVAP